MGRGKSQYIQFIKTPEARDYEKKLVPIIEEQIELQGWVKPDPGVKVHVLVDYYFKQKGTDPNNHLKILYDCLTKAEVYIDDDIALPQSGRMVIDKYNPRLEVTIFEDSSVGIFKGSILFDRFTQNNCLRCSKNQDKCSILKALLDNRIHDQVEEETTCLKIRLRK